MSFKAKIIENEEYYKLRRKLMLLAMIPIAPALLPTILFENRYWLLLPVVILSGCMGYVQWKLQKKFNRLIGNRKLIMGPDEIQITNGKHKVLLSFPVSELEAIELNTDFGMTHETQKELYKDVLKGESKKNTIHLIHNNNTVNSFDFEFDSYYMITQLKKLISHWESNAVNLTFSTSAKL